MNAQERAYESASVVPLPGLRPGQFVGGCPHGITTDAEGFIAHLRADHAAIVRGARRHTVGLAPDPARPYVRPPARVTRAEVKAAAESGATLGTYRWTEISEAGSVPVERVGQYWADGPVASSVWIVPCDGLDGDEPNAVLLERAEGVTARGDLDPAIFGSVSW